MPDPILNTALLYRTLDTVIEKEPLGLVDMTSWVNNPHRAVVTSTQAECRDRQAAAGVCGSTACFAGWTLLQDGGDVLENLDIRLADGTVIDSGDIGVKAREMLGLTAWEAEALFYASNNLTGIKHVVDRIAAGEYRSGTGDVELL